MIFSFPDMLVLIGAGDQVDHGSGSTGYDYAPVFAIASDK
jgi:hypothetical protein